MTFIIFDRCHCRWAAVAPVIYGCDSKNLTGIFLQNWKCPLWRNWRTENLKHLPDDHNDLTCLVGLLRYVDIGHVLSQMRHLLDACSIHYLQKTGHFWAWILVPSMKHKISVAVKCWYSWYVINMTNDAPVTQDGDLLRPWRPRKSIRLPNGRRMSEKLPYAEYIDVWLQWGTCCVHMASFLYYNTQSLNLHTTKQILSVLRFYPRPVLASRYCRCLHLCVCQSVSITCLSTW